ncbi:hypothetical protein CEXT_526191 [Caerostris extrusa]|uniref:Uncharacterized protein n=1 Tax=Caerostris extrusa TaxID=172846 RepID=A0AAV4PCH5_CAEEX|nr:hypothetical protein CEXT_526191 [Caerostris extrusa]
MLNIVFVSDCLVGNISCFTDSEKKLRAVKVKSPIERSTLQATIRVKPQAKNPQKRQRRIPSPSIDAFKVIDSVTCSTDFECTFLIRKGTIELMYAPATSLIPESCGGRTLISSNHHLSPFRPTPG